MTPSLRPPEGELFEIPPVASELGERFENAGHQLYLVGGAVRGAVMGTMGMDLDFATDARPAQVIGLLQGWADSRYLVGVEYGTVGARKGEHILEITTFREDVYRTDSRHPVVTYAKDVETDLARRDFTINAMAVRVPGGKLTDPHGGLYDLAHKRLRTPLTPEESFSDDPLRMLRAARFVSTLGVTPIPEVVEAIRRMRQRLQIISAERIRDELSKLLLGEHVDQGLELMVESGLAEQFIPEIPALRLQQDPVHRHKDVLRHTFAVVKRTEADLTLRLAALLHDIGKPDTRQVTAEGVQFHHHEVVGARLAEQRLRALRFPERVVQDVTQLVAMHLRFHGYRSWGDGGLRRYVRDAGPLLDKLNLLTRADCTTQNPAKARALAELQDELEERIARLAEQENLSRIRPPLDGHEVMEHLKLPPGPMVGKALDYLLQIRLDRGPISKEEAFRVLDEWWREQDQGE